MKCRVILLFVRLNFTDFLTGLYVQHCIRYDIICKFIGGQTSPKICISIAVSCIVYLTFLSSSAVLGAS